MRPSRTIGSSPVSILEPGRKRRHPMPMLTRLLWIVAAGIALVIVAAIVLH
jgi:hypothetical protein